MLLKEGAVLGGNTSKGDHWFTFLGEDYAAKLGAVPLPRSLNHIPVLLV